MEQDLVAVSNKYRVVRLFFSRPIVVIAIFYICGIIAGRIWISNPGILHWLLFLLCLPVGVLYRYKYIELFMAVLVMAAASAGGAAYIFAVQPAAGGITDYTGIPVYLEGTITEEPQFFSDHDSYLVNIEVIETRDGRFQQTGTILVKIYGEANEQYWFGERIRIRGSIVEPRGLRNPGGFDYRYYLKSQGVEALIYPKVSQVESLGQGSLNTITSRALEFRTVMVDNINQTLPSPSNDLLIAMLFGQRHRLPEDVAENFRRAGVGHLMAVSGLHVGLIAALILAVLRFLGLRRHLPLILAILSVLGYAYLTGMRPSAVRAALMISVALSAVLFDREHDISSAVAFAALMTLYFNPLLLFSMGFQLSYAATITLVYAYKPLKELLIQLPCPIILRNPIAVTLAAQIGVLPLCLYYFHTIPTGAIIFNLLLMPLLAFIVGFGLSGAVIAAFIPSFGALLIWASQPLLEIMLYVTALSRFSFLFITVHPPGISTMLLFYGFILIFVGCYYSWKSYGRDLNNITFLQYIKSVFQKHIPKSALTKKSLIIYVLLIAVVITWCSLLLNKPDQLRVTFIDVGQGASALVETPCGTVILIDAGGKPAFRGDPGEVGERVVAPLLRYLGIKAIDLAIVTHPHEDHFGGFIPLIEEMPVGHMLLSPVKGDSLYYDHLLDFTRFAGISVDEVHAGHAWACRCGVLLEVIAPPADLIRGTGSDLNNNSLVIMLIYKDIRMLFTGDIQDAAVRHLIGSKVNIKANLLLVPHHGGYFESAPEFIEEVKPEFAVIQVGLNLFGHPHLYVLDALDKSDVTVLRNDHHGAVVVETDGSRLEVLITEEGLVLY
ncbi:MAG: DNA internalization-related competence protein ComEC/Rec2 [Bacillota bacterium]|nr:DNA internalization-related competence protein ComEC/Rec2 [Bacillota bacterium]